MKPIAMPINIKLKVENVKHCRNPETSACNMSMAIQTSNQAG
jgi:hypothetical protein